MKIYNVTIQYEQDCSVTENEILKYIEKIFDYTTEQAKRHFEALSISDIQEIIICSGEFDSSMGELICIGGDIEVEEN